MALQKSKKSTCGTLQCPGDKVENEMSGVKALVEKVLVEVASLNNCIVLSSVGGSTSNSPKVAV